MGTTYPQHPLIAIPMVAIALASCSPTSARPDGKADSGPQCNGECVDWPTDARYDTEESKATKDAAPAPCVPQPIPPDVPEGWEEYPVMDCQYRMYVPSSKEYLPPPLTWEPCSSKTGPLSFDCRQIKMDWPSDMPAPYSLGGDQPAYVDANGKVVMQVRKIYWRSGIVTQTGCMSMLVEADGPVRQAFWRDYAPRNVGLGLGARNAVPGKSSWDVTEWKGGMVVRFAPFAGDDTLLRPPILTDKPVGDPDGFGVVAGEHFYLGTGVRWRVRRWDGTEMVMMPSSPWGTPVWVGPTLLLPYASSPDYAIFRWTEQDGLRLLIGYGGDYSRGAGNPGSDGKDLVWVEGEGRDDDSVRFPNRWIMTSKYSTDPSEIKPRRLTRWLDTPITTHAPTVGCGYVAFRYVIGENVATESGMLIVRLVDGWSWTLPSPPETGPEGWNLPTAITCDEVFARYKGGSLETIRRVRLDSLGPGSPPSE